MKIYRIIVLIILLLLFVKSVELEREAVSRISMLEKQIVKIRPTTITEVVEVKEVPLKGIRGEKGEKGEKGDAGELPKGHWERYCLYDKDVKGYPTEGVVIRQDQGDCDDDWRTVKLWEK